MDHKRKGALLILLLLVVVAMAILALYVGKAVDPDPNMSIEHDGRAVPSDSRSKLNTENLEGGPSLVERHAAHRAASIFTDATAIHEYQTAIQSFLNPRPVGKYRVVTFDGNLFRERLRRSGGQPSFEVTLLNDSIVELISIAGGEYHSGWQVGTGSMLGKVAGEELSTVQLFVSANNTIEGVIRSPSLGRVKIEAVPNSPFHVIWGWDASVNQQID